MTDAITKIVKQQDTAAPKAGENQAPKQSEAQEKPQKPTHGEPGFCCGSCS